MIQNKNHFVNSNLVTISDIFSYLNKSIAFFSNSKNLKKTELSKEKTKVIVDMLCEMETKLMNRHIPKNNEFGWVYEFVWTKDSFDLITSYCTDMVIHEDGSVSETHDKEILIERVKCNYLSVEEYAKKYNVTLDGVRQWIRRGKIRSAKKTGNGWYIPELADKPSRGYMPITYYFEEIPKTFINKYRFVENCEELSISQSNDDKNSYDIDIRYSNGKYKNMIVNRKYREAFELAIISNTEFKYHFDEWDSIQYNFNQNNKLVTKGDKIMKNDEYADYEKIQNEFYEEFYRFSTNSETYYTDFTNLMSISCTLYKANYENDSDDEIGKIENAIIIPSDFDTYDPINEENSYSLFDLCDSISGDLYEVYETMYDTKGGMKDSILKDLDMGGSNCDVQLLYIQNIETKNTENLNTFLKFFNIAIESMPRIYNGIAAVLINNEKENDKIISFINYGWKIIPTISKTCMIAYRKIN